MSMLLNVFDLRRAPAPIAKATGNARAAVRVSQHTGDQWRAYDALPAPIRQAIAQANVNFCPLTISQLFHQVLNATRQLGIEDEAVELYLERFDVAQQGEIEMFSRQEAILRGRPTAHVAAGATRLSEDTRPVRRAGRRIRPIAA